MLVLMNNAAESVPPTHDKSATLIPATSKPPSRSSGPLAVSGALTLNGQGDQNAVFIFQVASTLITRPPAPST